MSLWRARLGCAMVETELPVVAMPVVAGLDVPMNVDCKEKLHDVVMAGDLSVTLSRAVARCAEMFEASMSPSRLELRSPAWFLKHICFACVDWSQLGSQSYQNRTPRGGLRGQCSTNIRNSEQNHATFLKRRGKRASTSLLQAILIVKIVRQSQKTMVMRSLLVP